MDRWREAGATRDKFGWLAVFYAFVAASGATGPAPTRITVAGIAPETSEGRAAAVAFAEYEAENAATDGTAAVDAGRCAKPVLPVPPAISFSRVRVPVRLSVPS